MTHRLEVSSFAKINLGLTVLGRRPDGYHDLRTVLQTIDLCDRISLVRDESLTLETEGEYEVPADDTNLVAQAAALLAERFPGHGARIILKKAIPPGAGLGGGSSNAAATLLALDRFWGLGADPGLLHGLAASLGADVPFFLYGGRCLALGRGDEVLPLPEVPPWHVVVAWPGTGLATKVIYEDLGLALTRDRILSSMKGFVPSRPGAGGRSRGAPEAGRAPAGANDTRPPDLHNDLEEVAIRRLPAIENLKERLYESGALGASMSGSGSAVFGLFRSSKNLGKVATALSKVTARVFLCRTLSRNAYRKKLFEHPRT